MTRELKSGNYWEEIGRAYKKELCQTLPTAHGFVNIVDVEDENIHIACFNKELKCAIVVLGDWPILCGREDMDYMDNFAYIGSARILEFRNIQDFSVLEKDHKWFLQQCAHGQVEMLAQKLGAKVTTGSDSFTMEYPQIGWTWTKDIEEWLAKGPEPQKKVLWFSRHEMTADQRAALGNCKVTQINRSIQNAYELEKEIQENDIIAIVAPINLQQQFLKIAGEKPVIMAVNDRVLIPQADGSEDKVEFRFVKWERLLKIEVVKEDFVI